MLKRSLIFLLVCFMALCVGCGKEDKAVKVDDGDTSSVDEVVEETPIMYTNPLTGEKNLTLEESKQQPTAIMINNISIAQAVQTGVNKADIVYETEVEGGITRLMAVYQNIDKVQRIGTIRSARYVYVDLALGHNAIYLHEGQDPIYCAPHLKDIEHYAVGGVGERIKNGLASEHTLYADGADLHKAFMKDKKLDNATAWQNFSADEADITLTGGTATDVTIPFSTSYTTQFKYDTETKKYTRHFRGNANKDYVTGETTQVKNVFVLQTSISYYTDASGKLRVVDLNGGDGYYFVNGTYVPIKWSKGASKNSFKFTNIDGTDLTVNQGNSWVCIASKANSVTIK